MGVAEFWAPDVLGSAEIASGGLDSAGEESCGSEATGALTCDDVLDDATPVPGLGAHCRYARPANTSTTAPSRYFHARFCVPSDSSRPLKARSRSHCTSASDRGGIASPTSVAPRWSATPVWNG